MVLADFPDILAQVDPAHHSVESTRLLKAGSLNRLNWVCDKGPDHTWDTTLKARCSARTGCPCCSGNKVSITNCLHTLFPALNAELLPANRNGGLTGPGHHRIRYGDHVVGVPTWARVRHAG